MKIETKRLILRKPRLSDWRDLVEGANNKKISKQFIGMPFPYTKKDALSRINKLMLKWRKKKKIDYNFFIELKDERKIIGEMILGKVDKIQETAKTDSWINENYWKKGYITEAKIAVNDFAFNKLKLRRLDSLVLKKNIASNKTQQKMGYKLEGMKRKAVKNKITGKIHDLNIYGLLKEEWKKVRPKIVKKLNEKIKKLEK